MINSVRSNAYIEGAGNLEDKNVISALYAQGQDATITLEGNQNYLTTYADSSSEDLERVIWAFDAGSIGVNGYTFISTDSYEKANNSKDIAIAAGSATGLTEEDVNNPVDNRASVSIVYDDAVINGQKQRSMIVGDILAAYAGSVNITAQPSIEVHSEESSRPGIHIIGNLLAGNNGIMNIDLGTGGSLTGRADDYGDASSAKTDLNHAASEFFNPAFSSDIYAGGTINLKMGNDSRWNVTGQSWITSIETNSSAISDATPVIDLVNAHSDLDANGHALTVYNLKGNAVFNMDLSGDRSQSDMLYIRNAEGEYLVNIVNAVTLNDIYADGYDGLRFATVGTGSKAQFRAITVDQGVLNVEYEVDTDQYDGNAENDGYNGGDNISEDKPGSSIVDDLFSSSSSDSAAYRTLALAEEETGTDLTETTNFKLVGRKGETLSDAGRTILNMSRANYAAAVYMDTLNKRLGEMRFAKGREDGLWARIRHDEIGKRSSFDTEGTMIEIGADSLSRKDTGEFHTGIAIDYMDGDTDYHDVRGDGEQKRYGAWFYTTWIGDNNAYWDFVFKFGHLENDFDIFALSTGEEIKGDYDNQVLSASLEYGRKFENKDRWYVEPQGQLQYAYVTSADYETSQGTKVELEDINSLIGRVGVRLGKDFDTQKPMTFYVRGDILHEFLGRQDISATDQTGRLSVRYDNDDTWYSAGAGFTFMGSEDLYFFLEAEKVFGASNTGSYSVSGGMKYLF